MRSLVIEPDAERDICEAKHGYEAHRPGLGSELAAELDSAIAAVTDHPDTFRLVRRDARRALLRRFPYVLLFARRGDVVHLLGMIHTSHDPKVWLRRAGKFGA